MTDPAPLRPHVVLSTADGAALPPLTMPYTLDRWRQDLAQLAGGAATGFDVLEDVGLRWVPGKLYAVIARPGGGKTATMLEAAARAIEHDETPADAVAVFCSWEEPLAELVARLFLRADARARHDGVFVGTPIPRAVVRAWGRGDTSVGPDARRRLDAVSDTVAQLLGRLRLVDGDTLGRYVHQALAEVGRWMREAKTRPVLVCVDYFQKLRAAGHYPSRQAELLDVSDALRRFAKGEALSGNDPATAAATTHAEWAVPLLVGAQVNRADAVAGHPNGDNIREADDLLNDSAGVIALSYLPGEESGDEARTLRVSVPKNRDGRARRDEVAALAWRPARAWITPHAARDTYDRVLWSTPKLNADETPANGDRSGDRKNSARRSGARSSTPYPHD